jgi:RNA recognition motif-containing protein
MQLNSENNLEAEYCDSADVAPATLDSSSVSADGGIADTGDHDVVGGDAQHQAILHDDPNGELQAIQRRNQVQQQQQAASGPVNTSSRGAFRVVEGLNLYVSQLPPSYNSTRLREVFTQFGAIHSAKVMHDARTNESRCFGFVLFERASDGERAIAEMSGVVLEEGGNRLQIRVARPTALPQPLRDDAATEGSEFLVKSPVEGGRRTPSGFGSNDEGDEHQYHGNDQPRYHGGGNRNYRNSNNHHNFNHHNNNNNNNYSRRAPNFSQFPQQQQQQQQYQPPLPPSSAPPSHLSSPSDQDMMMSMVMPMSGMMPMAPMPFGAMYPSSAMMAAPYMMMPNSGYSMMPTPSVYYVPTAFPSGAYPLMPAQGGTAAPGYLPYQASASGQWPTHQQQ